MRRPGKAALSAVASFNQNRQIRGVSTRDPRRQGRLMAESAAQSSVHWAVSRLLARDLGGGPVDATASARYTPGHEQPTEPRRS